MKTIANAPIDLREITLDFTRDVIKFCKSIHHVPLAQPVVHQLIRSSSSVGANFIEAKNASSKKDFRNKIFISKKEASETMYWLRVCEEFTDSKELLNLQQECQEIILILQRIVSPLSN